MTSVTGTVFSIARDGERWCVSVDGDQLATALTPARALETALDAAAILRRSGVSATVGGAASASEPRSFDPPK